MKPPKMIVLADNAWAVVTTNMLSKLMEIVAKEVKCRMTVSHQIKNISKAETILKVPNVNSGLEKYNINERMTRRPQREI